MSQALAFRNTSNNHSGHVEVVGDLDRDAVPKAWSERAQWVPAEGEVVLDLANVEHVDSAGLALLIRLRSELEAQNRTLSLRHVNKQLQQFAEVSGVQELLSIS